MICGVCGFGEDEMKKIRILLATYNGEKYLGAMIDSILAQDYTNWELIISDDGSTDKTVEVIGQYVQLFPTKIIFYQSGKKFGGAKYHFMHLLEYFADAEYIMFADQDDIWHSDKITKTWNRMLELETEEKRPILVHTDLRVVDEQLNCLNASFMQFSNLDGNRLKLNNLLIQNVVTGCTVMINQELIKMVVDKIPQEGMRMHDWWLALAAATCGTIGFVEEATIDYRQHGTNTVGAKNSRSLKYIYERIFSGENYLAIKYTFMQADTLRNCFGDLMPEKAFKLVCIHADLLHANPVKRRATYIRYGIFKKGIGRKIGQLIYG